MFCYWLLEVHSYYVNKCLVNERVFSNPKLRLMTNTFIQNKWIFEDPLRMLKRGKITRKGSHFFQRIIILVPIYRKMDFFVFSSTFKPFQFQWTPKYELLVVWRGDLQKNVKLLRIIFLTQRQQFPHLWIICWSHFPHFWPLSSAFGSFFWLNWSRGVGSRGSSSSLQSSCSHLSILTFPNGLPWMGTLKSHEWTPNAKYEPLVLWKGRPRVMTGQSIQKYWIFEGPLKGPWYWGGEYIRIELWRLFLWFFVVNLLFIFWNHCLHYIWFAHGKWRRSPKLPMNLGMSIGKSSIILISYSHPLSKPRVTLMFVNIQSRVRHFIRLIALCSHDIEQKWYSFCQDIMGIGY